jgi:hypothetical protein
LVVIVYASLAPQVRAAACGGEGQPRCEFASAKLVSKPGCQRGSFFDPRKGGECWSCPQGYKRTLAPVTANNACQRPARTTTARAGFQRKPGCPRGSFFDPRKGGECWACPGGFKRSLAPVTANNACVKPAQTSVARATYRKKAGCPRGSFFDPRKGGECWSCPSGYRRSLAPVTAKNACAKGILGKVARAKFRGKPGCGNNACGKGGRETVAQASFKGRSGCPRGSFFDPRKGGECWSCPSGHKRTLAPVTANNACAITGGGGVAQASFRHKFGCPKGSFFDPRKGGECWSCPARYNRSIHPVTGNKACTIALGLACAKGLVNIGGVCRNKGACGARNQRPCLIVERIPSCDRGLREDFGTNRCVPLKAGETPFTAGLSSLTGEIAKGTQICEDALTVFPQFKSGIKAADLGASCHRNMTIGFACAAPGAAQKISDTAELTHKVAREFDRSPCKDELKWSRAKATLHGSSKGLKCAKGQFFDLMGKGTCWSCPRGYTRNLEPVNSRHACTRVAGTPAMFRAQCAVVMAVVRDADKQVNCLGAMIRTGLLPEAFRGKEKDMCLMAGGEAFFATLDYLTGTPNPKTTIERIVKRIRQVNSAFNNASKANDFLEKVNGLRECRGVIGDGSAQTASYQPPPSSPPANSSPAPIGSGGTVTPPPAPPRRPG